MFIEENEDRKVLARRIHLGWLLVEGGDGRQERQDILTHLHAAIDSPLPRVPQMAKVRAQEKISVS